MIKGKKLPLESPEDSIPLRLAVLAMVIICAVGCCFFVNTNPMLTLFYVWGAITGAYVSYHYRHTKNIWLTWIVAFGSLGITINCAYEIINGFENGPLGLLGPIVHQVAGVLTLLSFELRSRKDLNTQAVLALILLCVSSPAYRGISFGICIMLYLCVGAVVLYFDNRSRTLQSSTGTFDFGQIAGSSAEDTPQEGALESARFLKRDLGVLASLPLCGFLIFFFVPRSDYALDIVNSFSKSFVERGFRLAEPPPLKSPSYQIKLPPISKKCLSPIVLPPSPPEEKGTLRRLDKDKKKERAKDKNKNKEGLPEPNRVKKRNRQAKPLKLVTENITIAEKSKHTSHSGNKHKSALSPSDKAESKPKLNTEKMGVKPGAAKNSMPSVSDSRGTGKCQSKPNLNKAGQRGKPNSDSSLDTKLPGSKSNKLLFTVASTRTGYYRQSCFDYFDGSVWSVTNPDRQASFLHPERGLYDLSHYEFLTLPKGFSSVGFVQDYSLKNALGKLMPTGGIPQKIDYSGAVLKIDPLRRLSLEESLVQGSKYKVYALLPVYNLKLMRRLERIDEASETKLRKQFADDLQIPDDQGSQIRELAKQLRIDSDNWFERCERFSYFLKKTYKYTLEKSPSDKPVNTVDQFMFVKKAGDCKDFASAFVILCRLNGIPSRCVAGYAPGKANLVSGLREVYEADSHVWAEAYIPGYDWVPFDATPNGTMPDRAKEVTYSLSSLTKHLGSSSERNIFKLALMISAGIFAAGFLIAGAVFGGKILWAWYRLNMLVHPAKRLYDLVMKRLKGKKIVKQPSETSSEFINRLRLQIKDGTEPHFQHYLSLPDTLDEFLDTYEAIYFGNQNQLPKLKYLSTRVAEELLIKR